MKARFISYRRLRCLRTALIACVVCPGTSMVGSNLFAQVPVIGKLTSWAKSHGKPPSTAEDKVLEQLAANVDWVEHHINQWGSVSSKAPDVWGEARLTQYRNEVESILAPQRTNFDPTLISGAQQVSDSAILAFALALQNKGAGVDAPSISVQSTAVSTDTTSKNPKAVVNINSQLPTAGNNAFGASTTHFLGMKLGLEQTQVINQLQCYLQHLNQHRRINEGDDTSDAPGYALNLVRVPISILPGTITRRGYGAEVTFTAKPYLGPDLLPMTFRDLVLNDVMDQLSIPLVKFINSDPNGADVLLAKAKKAQSDESTVHTSSGPQFKFGSSAPLPAEFLESDVEVNQMTVTEQLTSVCAISFSGNQSRRGTQPFPPTQIIDVYGLDQMKELAIASLKGLREDLPNRRVVHVSDVKAFLREELSAAIELMYAGGMHQFWDRESTGEKTLYHLIRQRDTTELEAYRTVFLSMIPATGRSNLTRSLAWCVFVDSILLNERLNEDIRETGGTRPSTLQNHSWLPFFGPSPGPQARDCFAEYVQTRWPIRIFALDPQIDQQSVADVSSIVRQMQLAVVLGFSSGEIGLSTALDTIRKLQRDRATIDLNRTAIAFGQGDDTFGWRFRPRFQTPPVEGNAKVFFRDLIAGGPTDKQLERGFEIEPGMRECTAIILMPSFVPFVTLETHGHWFKLANPGHTGTSIQEDVQLSRAIKQMQDCAATSVRCAHLYRDGEVDRVMARVHQLERRLPLQTISCQVPIENTHGGFELFSNGTRQLAPEISGWYGAPGYDPKKGASFFIAGDNFSIKQSHVIAGNHYLTEGEFQLISRQIMRVTLPPGLPILADSRIIEHDNPRIPHDQRYSGYVDVQIATPYGVSAHQLIPVLNLEPKEPAAANGPKEPCPMTTLHTAGDKMMATLVRNEKGEFAKIVSESSMLPAIGLPKDSQVGVTNRTVRLYLSRGTDRLAPVLFKDVALSRSRDGYQIGADTFLESLGAKGDLFHAVQHYASYLESNKKIPEDKKLDLTAEYSIEFDKIEIPVSGSFPIAIRVQ